MFNPFFLLQSILASFFLGNSPDIVSPDEIREANEYLTTVFLSNDNFKEEDAQLWEKKITDICTELSTVFADNENFFDYPCRVFNQINIALWNIEEFESRLNAYLLYGNNLDNKNKVVGYLLKIKDNLRDFFTSPVIYKKIIECQKKLIKILPSDDHCINFAERIIKIFYYSGAGLDNEKRDELYELQEKFEKAQLNFQQNINNFCKFINFSRDELEGINDEQILLFKMNDDNTYTVTIDVTSLGLIMSYCSNKETRKKFFTEFLQRAAPDNFTHIATARAVLQKMAELFSLRNGAELMLTEADTMAKTPDTVSILLDGVAEAVKDNAANEINVLKNFAKNNCNIENPDQYDLSYIMTTYEEKEFNINEEFLHGFFPTKKVMHGIQRIARDCFGIELVFWSAKGAKWAWSDDLYVAGFRDKETKKMKGYIVLDLYPRDYKRKHGGIQQINFQRKKDGVEQRSVSLICACFTPKKGADNDAYMSFGEIQTLLHEMGHGFSFSTKTESPYYLHQGAHSPNDVAELYSQLMEFFLSEPRFILMMSDPHKKTGERISDEIIEKVIKKYKFGKWISFSGMVYHSGVLLDFYTENDSCIDIKKKWAKKIQLFDPSVYIDHPFECSWVHVIGYGPEYYSYLFSRTYARLIFKHLKKHNFSREEGELYVDILLSSGTIYPYEEIITAFLGHRPTFSELLEDFLQK